VIHYSNPEANNARYRLKNYDRDWRPTGMERTAYYYDIPPGQYTLQIMAESSEGVWAEKFIDIIIAPPWWRSWWAYCMYGLSLIAVVYALHRIQKQRVISKERERARVREQAQAKEIEKAYNELKITQGQLIQSEKMASLGELTAGIAHEIQNPLNFVNNFAEVNTELIDELGIEAEKGNFSSVKSIAKDIQENERKISHHGKRADAIVKSMLQHSQSGSGKKEPTNINALADEYLRLAFHGLRAKDSSFNASMKTEYDKSVGQVSVIQQDLGRVLLNLYNNAFYAVHEKSILKLNGYEPTVSVSTSKADDKIEIRVKDNGNGIPQKIKDKIFQPFFTTKSPGQGTGLGLSLSYDIIKAHGGEIKVETNDGEFTEFIIRLNV
jgi:signal transduction histidine kinase